MEQAGNCDDRPEIVVATMEMARLHPDLYRTMAERFGTFVRTELEKLARQAADAGHVPMSDLELDVMGDTVVALLAHCAGPAGASVPRERLIGLVDGVLMVLLTGARASG